jgi:hypothetical protein
LQFWLSKKLNLPFQAANVTSLSFYFYSCIAPSRYVSLSTYRSFLPAIFLEGCSIFYFLLYRKKSDGKAKTVLKKLYEAKF